MIKSVNVQKPNQPVDEYTFIRVYVYQHPKGVGALMFCTGINVDQAP